VGILDPRNGRPSTVRLVRTLYDALRTHDHHTVVWPIPAVGAASPGDLGDWVDRHALDLLLVVGAEGRIGPADLPVRGVLVPDGARDLHPPDPRWDAILCVHPEEAARMGPSAVDVGFGVSPTFVRRDGDRREHHTFHLRMSGAGDDELLDVVLLAFEEISRVVAEVSLVVEGRPPARDGEAGGESVLGGAGGVVHLGAVSAGAPFRPLGRTLIQVTPGEGWVSPVAEAMMAGVAVIVPDDPIFAPLVDEDHTGLRVRTVPGDGEGRLRLDAVDLADRMLHLARDPREARRLGRNAAREAATQFGFGAFASRLDAVLEELRWGARAA
jgi:hypothetical protein